MLRSEDNTKIFEGTFKNGEYWTGKGTQFDETNEIRYKGEFLEGKWIGNGVLYFGNGTT